MAVLLHLADRRVRWSVEKRCFRRYGPVSSWVTIRFTQVVIKLRKALGDDPDRPTYIQTVTKRGYRLVAPVLRPAGTAAPPMRDGRTGFAGIAGAAALALLVAAAFGGAPASKGEDFRRVPISSPTLRSADSSR
jgi:hypothetical protein